MATSITHKPSAAYEKRYGSLKHLREAGIASSWPQLNRLIQGCGFPPGFIFGKNKRYWDLDEVDEWIQSRRVAAE